MQFVSGVCLSYVITQLYASKERDESCVFETEEKVRVNATTTKKRSVDI